MDYYTLDFETANANPTSPCSIGIVGVQNGKIVLKEYHLINPEEEFLPFNIAIHGITPEDVRGEGTFPEVWGLIKPLFQSSIIFAHCAGFDFNVLYQTMEKYGLDKPTFRFGDTLRIANLLWDKSAIPNHKLDTIAQYLEYEFDHHNALSDASVCVKIIERAKKILQAGDAKEVYDALSLRFGYFGPKRFFDSYQLKKRYRKDRPRVDNPLLYDKLIIYSGKPESMPKTLFLETLLNQGAYVDTIVSKKADYFVPLTNCKEEKRRQVDDLIEAGTPIEIISEAALLRMVKS